MNKYILSLGGFAIALILVGAGCNATTTDDTDTVSNIAIEKNIVNTKKIDDTKTQQKADVVLDITGKNFSFSQNEIQVKEGDIVTINFKSIQGFHDFVIDEFDVATQQVNPGTQTSVTFVANKVGEYEYYCSVGNHRTAGMKGKLIVTPAKEITKSIEGTYEDYDSSKVAQAAENGNVVLFFHASWCSSCKALDNSLKKEKIPGDLTVFKLDYDTEGKLKKKYGVTSQNTLVQVDAQGNLIQKKIGFSKLTDITNWVK